ncbi:hypothetical protein TBLA_0B01580 [Henningerozyma blattae CBS 6284]|uniref:BAR domain-containing protein n=1 Tax=Henningerozyma blattae (strain ATCC 34711 / CBS 6284 / DSM 70876 / NBRC 10599 / NRRL Y-10934 / UCD 77-7) TaxID=1071380 RepID=I2GXZ9_HENB6|nr:hypothetical protein TBLA_0B01580 [Tetrapisispora blattae CBS 6284]CCH59001.1 hypothetical protein TBLA_0B01580 [Tetrapisispora blattae CBS 6284]
MQEKFGQVTDISPLPQEYLDLEQQVDSIKLVYDHFLRITTVYENESYDYPKDVRDSITEFQKTASSRVQELQTKISNSSDNSHSSGSVEPMRTSVSSVGSINNYNQNSPRTLNNALSKAALFAAEQLKMDKDSSTVFHSFSEAESIISDERIKQDKIIQKSFNTELKNVLTNRIDVANKHRKDVQNKRLQYDISRTKLDHASEDKESSLRVAMEQHKQAFEQSIDDAIIMMHEVISHSNFITNLNELAMAQLEYHERSFKALQDFITTMTYSNSASSTAHSNIQINHLSSGTVGIQMENLEDSDNNADSDNLDKPPKMPSRRNIEEEHPPKMPPRHATGKPAIPVSATSTSITASTKDSSVNNLTNKVEGITLEGDVSDLDDEDVM